MKTELFRKTASPSLPFSPSPLGEGAGVRLVLGGGLLLLCPLALSAQSNITRTNSPFSATVGFVPATVGAGFKPALDVMMGCPEGNNINSPG